MIGRALVALVGLAVLGVMLGLAYAGSPRRIAGGVRIAGIDVGGLTPSAAAHLLERRAQAVAGVPVVFTAGGQGWRLRPDQLGVNVDWSAAVALAQRQGGGFGPFRGFRRIGVRVFGADVAPPTRVYDAALSYELDRIAAVVTRPHREAALRLAGLRPVIVPAQSGRILDRAAAEPLVVHALAGFARRPVPLPLRVDQPAVTAADLAPVAKQVRQALSAAVWLRLGPTTWRLPRWQIAKMLDLPRDGARSVALGGPAAARYFANLRRAVDRPATDADFAVAEGGAVRVVPSRAGRRLDVTGTGERLLSAALQQQPRLARVVVASRAPKLTTARARSMGITGLIGGYETIYGGEANRIHNVQLVARLLDKHLIAPGATFSFNRTTGERSAAKGFLEAPVIINGELQTGLGGGVCQVSTTVFNAAYEAGLKITARTNHALYISHYPLGRDATVDYPDVDLRFVNDTQHWLLLRTFVGSVSLVVNLYGTPVHRRVVTQTRPLVETGPPPLKTTRDPSLAAGAKVLDSSGEPSRSTSVRRLVYSATGKLLEDDTWYSSYRAEPRLVRVGAKPKPKAKPKPAPKTPVGGAGHGKPIP